MAQKSKKSSPPARDPAAEIQERERQKQIVTKCLLENIRSSWGISLKVGCSEPHARELIAEVQSEMDEHRYVKVDNKTLWALMQTDYFIGEMWRLLGESGNERKETTVEVSPKLMRVIRTKDKKTGAYSVENVYQNVNKVTTKVIQRDPNPAWAGLILKGMELRGRMDGTLRPTVMDEIAAIESLVRSGVLPDEVLENLAEFSQNCLKHVKDVFRRNGRILTEADEEDIARMNDQLLETVQEARSRRSGAEAEEVEVQGEEVKGE